MAAHAVLHSEPPSQGAREKVTLLSFDPGLVNCCCVLLESEEGRKPRPLWARTWDLSGGSKPDAEAADRMAGDVKLLLQQQKRRPRAVVEYQPPLRRGGIAIVRYNCWVEGYICGMLASLREQGLVEGAACQVHPSACKQHWKIRAGEYAVNKALARAKAAALVEDPRSIPSDHVADCVLNALYAIAKK